MTLIAGTATAHSLVDLKMSVEAPSFAATRQRFTYRIVADDLANDNALGVVVTNTLPPSVSFVKASGSGWNCSESKLKVTCSAEQLTPGPNVITIDVTAPAASGPITDSVTVTSLGSVDANAGNDNASATTTIYDPAACPAATLQLLPVTANRLAWTPVPNAKSYAIYAAVEGERTALVNTTTATSAAIAFERGNVEWHVEALLLGGCPTVVSAPGHFISAGHAAALAVSTFTRDLAAPSGVAVDANGDLFVADRGSQTIRLISHGAVTTMSGTPQISGAADGRPAAFADPMGIVITPLDDFLFIADRGNDAIRLRYPGDANLGFVITIGGALAQGGMTDGLAEVSRFSAPSAIAADPRGRLYVADTGNGRIRKMTTVTGYVGYYSTSTFADGLLNPAGVAVDGEDTVYVADTGNHTIRKFVNGAMTTLAGSNGESGSADGYGAEARFNHPTAMALDARGNLFVCDTGNHTIRKVSPTGLVTTVAGLAGSAGDSDGVASTARFSSPGAIVVDSSGAIYIADTGNHRICVAQTAVPADRRRAVRP